MQQRERAKHTLWAKHTLCRCHKGTALSNAGLDLIFQSFSPKVPGTPPLHRTCLNEFAD